MNDGQGIIWNCTIYIIVYTTPGSLRDRVIVYEKTAAELPLNSLKGLQLELEEKIGENEWK